ncbi:hypothetical protein AB8615_11860 [Litorimonas sp. RW-G-Af-16]|uniref:hypothetical protein n=1 Tax=Litorimonas sp. RW-G-Af-16 TaxID=3241168 RepID=UPI003AACDF4B
MTLKTSSTLNLLRLLLMRALQAQISRAMLENGFFAIFMDRKPLIISSKRKFLKPEKLTVFHYIITSQAQARMGNLNRLLSK